LAPLQYKRKPVKARSATLGTGFASGRALNVTLFASAPAVGVFPNNVGHFSRAWLFAAGPPGGRASGLPEACGA